MQALLQLLEAGVDWVGFVKELHLQRVDDRIIFAILPLALNYLLIPKPHNNT